MVSWDMEVKFFGLSPNIEELKRLAKQECFSNIEEMKFIKVDNDRMFIYRLIVNNRGLKQKEFKYEKVK